MPINNYAFIDGNNLHLTFIGLGVPLKYDKLLSYLKKRHNVTTAYYFIGRIPQNQHIYDTLTSFGYTLKFRDVTKKKNKTVICPACGKTFQIEKGRTKCDCDADLALQVIGEIDKYDKAIIISSDGDFDNLVKRLNSLDKLDMVLAPSKKGCSHLLSSAARGRIAFLDGLIDEIENIEGEPYGTETHKMLPRRDIPYYIIPCPRFPSQHFAPVHTCNLLLAPCFLPAQSLRRA